MASKTHKDRVQEFNAKLELLSEHHDIPKVSLPKGVSSAGDDIPTGWTRITTARYACWLKLLFLSIWYF